MLLNFVQVCQLTGATGATLPASRNGTATKSSCCRRAGNGCRTGWSTSTCPVAQTARAGSTPRTSLPPTTPTSSSPTTCADAAGTVAAPSPPPARGRNWATQNSSESPWYPSTSPIIVLYVFGLWLPADRRWCG